MPATATETRYPDPRTREFHHLQPTYALDDTAGQLRGLQDDGFALIPNVLSPEEVERARAEIDRLRPFGFDRQGQVDHYKCVFNRDPYWLPFIDRPGVVDLAEASMGEEAHIVGMSAWRSHPDPKPGEWHVGSGMHTDQLFFACDEELLVSGRVHLPIFMCTAHYYLSDITIDLCPTWVIPGSHKSGRSPRGMAANDAATWRGRDAQPVLLRAGDVLFFRSEVWHSGSKNASDRTRYLLQVHYSHRMITQKFSPYIDWRFNQEVLAHANERQLKFLGKHKPSNYD